MAKRPPYFPLYVLDFTGDPVVLGMSTKGVGAYILLLCTAWHQDPPASLPNDDRLLARYARLAPDDWQEVKPEVTAGFTLGEDGRLHQRRLRREYDQVMRRFKSSRDNGKRGGRPPRGDPKTDGKPKENPRVSSRLNTGASGFGSGSGSDSSQPELPEALNTSEFQRAWHEWHEYRKQAKLKPYTPIGAKKQLTRLEKIGHDRAVAAIEHSIANNWHGIHEPGGGAASGGKPAQASRTGRQREQDRGEFTENIKL